MDRNKSFNSHDLQRYANESSLRLNKYQQELIDYTMKMSNNFMMGSIDCAQLFQLMIKSINGKKCLEVGCFTGYTALTMALALGDDGQVITTDVNRDRVAFDIWRRAGVAEKIKFIEGPAVDSLSRLLEQGHGGTFDFVFIDADKANYRMYYELALKLLRPRGIIAIDNVLWGGSVIDPRVQDSDTRAIRDLNAFIRDDPRVDIIMLVIGDGVTFCLKK